MIAYNGHVTLDSKDQFRGLDQHSQPKQRCNDYHGRFNQPNVAIQTAILDLICFNVYDKGLHKTFKK